MSIARRNRRVAKRDQNAHIAYLGDLLGGFYEFLSGYIATTADGESVDKDELKSCFSPTTEQVRKEFNSRNKKWELYCAKNKLMNTSHLFKMNVAEAWKRHSHSQSSE